MDCVGSERRSLLLSEGKNAFLHTREMEVFPVAYTAGSFFEVLRLSKRSSALAMLSEEITVPQLETSEVERGAGKSG